MVVVIWWWWCWWFDPDNDDYGVPIVYCRKILIMMMIKMMMLKMSTWLTNMIKINNILSLLEHIVIGSWLKLPPRQVPGGASPPLSALWVTGKILERGRSNAIWQTAGWSHHYIDGGGNDEDRLGRCVEVSSAHVVICMSRSSPIFRFYQLAECKQEVPLMPGLKDQLEKGVGLKKRSQWFIQ